MALANAAPFPIISDRYGTLEVPVDMAGFLKSMDESTPYTGELLGTDLMHIGQMMKELSIKTESSGFRCPSVRPRTANWAR